MAASIGCSFSGVGFLLQNHYPRSTGAPSCRFRTLTRRPPSVDSGLRVRGGERVRLAVYLKALACNVKRMVGARLIEMNETLARPAALAAVPAAA